MKKKKKTIIETKNVWKIYDLGETKVNALRGIDIQIKKGDYVSIIGPSGSGKSTCMHIIGCLDKPSKGKTYLDGKDISEMTESELAQIRGKKIGFVFQFFNLIPTLNALENVALPMSFQKVPEKERHERAKELLEMVDLGDRLDHKPNQLSGGQQQRVAIARALANDPEIILADEPTGNLDSKTGKQIMELLDEIRKKGRTIILVTHDPKLAKKAKRMIKLKDGEVDK